MLQSLGGQAVTLSRKWVVREMGYRVADVTLSAQPTEPTASPARRADPHDDATITRYPQHREIILSEHRARASDYTACKNFIISNLLKTC